MAAVACRYSSAHRVHMVKNPTIIAPFHSLPSPCTCVYQYEQELLRWDLLNQVPQLLPQDLFQLCVGFGFRWGIGN